MTVHMIPDCNGTLINPSLLASVEPPNADGVCEYWLTTFKPTAGMRSRYIHVKYISTLADGSALVGGSTKPTKQDIKPNRCTDCVHMPELLGQMCIVGHYHATRNRRKCAEYKASGSEHTKRSTIS